MISALATIPRKRELFATVQDLAQVEETHSVKPSGASARKLDWSNSARRDEQPNQSAAIGKHSEHNNDSNGHHNLGSDRRTFKPLRFHSLAICCNPNGSAEDRIS
jgi:hypothetical protein